MNQNNPQISIVILTKNGGISFKECLNRIFSQDSKLPYEVIVVDSGSIDKTLDEIGKFPVRLFKIRPDQFKFGPVRDYGFSKARGSFIVTLSQDAIPCDNAWLQQLITPFEDDSIAAVQGTEVKLNSRDVFFWERIGSFYFTSENMRWLKEHAIGLSFVNAAIRTEIWQKYKCGDVPMSEDKLFQKKLTENGRRVYLTKDAKVYHGHSYTVRSLIRRCENEGLGWKCAGMTYSFFDMFHDLISIKKFKILIRGIISREVSCMSELLFPVIRPVWLFRGNHFTKNYRY